MSCEDEGTTTPLKNLQAPERNHFYFGKKMGVAQFQREQTYHRTQRALINRLAIGQGVLCGLKVEISGEQELLIHSGVAMDGLGRLVIVPQDTRYTIPQEIMEERRIILSICYRECAARPAPVPCSDPCHPDVTTMYDALVETFELELRPEERPVVVGPKKKAVTFPSISNPALNERVLNCAVPDHLCLDLARLRLSDGNLEDLQDIRDAIPSNRELFEMVSEIARRVGLIDDDRPTKPRQPFGGVVVERPGRPTSEAVPLSPKVQGTPVTTDLTHIAISFEEPMDEQSVKKQVRVWYIRSGETGRSPRELKDLSLEEDGKLARFRYDRKSRAQDGKYIIEIGDDSDLDSVTTLTFIASDAPS